MSVTNQTTQQIADNIIAQLEATLNQTIPLLPKSFMRVMAKAVAGVYVLLYKYVGFGQLQGFVRTASAKPTTINGKILTPLFEWGELIGVGLPAAATRAEFLIDITVENQGGILPSGSQVLYAPTGVTYITIGAVALDSPTIQVAIRAVADQSGNNGAGAIGNLDAGTVLSFASPLSDVARDVVASAVSLVVPLNPIVTGADGEDIEVYRQRVLSAFRARPQGGALADYRLWGVEPAGIVSIYPYRSNCPGQVEVYAEATPESSGNEDGIPTVDQLAEVKESIEFNENGLADRRPVGALVVPLAIFRTGFIVKVVGLVVDPADVATVQSQITAAIVEFMLEREPFIVGLSFAPRLDQVTQPAIGGIVSNIVSANNGTFNNVVLEVGGTSQVTYTLGVGEKAKSEDVIFL